MPRGYHVLCASLQIAQPPQRTDDPMADLLDHVSCSAGADGGDVGIRGGLGGDKPRLAALVGAIHIDSLKEDHVEMQIAIEGTPKTLHKRDRPWLDLGAWAA